jgi:methionine biosynthesis protein MetW
MSSAPDAQAASAADGLTPNQRAIAALVPPGSRVLDLGCGDGSLLAHLRAARGCHVYGVELDDANLLACVARGLNVIQLDLEQGLSMFGDASFDVVLQIDTLPNIRHTERALAETARVGRLGIVGFANFAYWPLRLQVLRGRLPVTAELPYAWYDTPNLRVATFADFAALAAQCKLEVRDAFGLRAGRVVRRLPNLLASEAVFVVAGRPAAAQA